MNLRAITAMLALAGSASACADGGVVETNTVTVTDSAGISIVDNGPLELGRELFQRDKSVISRHIKNVFSEGVLRRESVAANYATTATDGKTYQVEYFNLDVIISVGYRIKSHRGTQFRIWATQRLLQTS